MSHLRSRFGMLCSTVVLSLALALAGCATKPAQTAAPSTGGTTAETAKAPAPAAKRSIAHALGGSRPGSASPRN